MRKHFLENRIPPPIVLLLTILLIRFIAGYDHSLEVSKEWRISAAVIFVVLGVAIDISSALLFRKSKTTVNPLKPTTSNHLVVSGLFKYSRNPMYVGMLLISLGAVCYYASPFSVIAVVGFMLFITRYQIIPEERAMLELFGDEFINYQKQVRRWF